MKTKMLIVGIVLAALLVTVSSASAIPEVTTDKEDYAPGEDVIITGTGFTSVADTGVTITIIRPPTDPAVPPDEDTCGDPGQPACPVTDATGGFTYVYDLNGIYGDYTVVAVDDEGKTATTTFTDGRTIQSVTLDGGDSVTVAPGASISVSITVDTTKWWIFDETDDWESTRYVISGVTSTCVDTPDHLSAGTHTETFTITAPSTPGTYDVHFRAYNGDTCSALYPSGWKTLSNGITVGGETSLQEVLDSYDCHQQVAATEHTWIPQGAYTATALLVTKQSAYANPTGWYDASTNAKTVLFNDPKNQVGDTENINTGNEFGLYIDSSDGPGGSTVTFYSENSKHGGSPNVEVYRVDDVPGGGCNYNGYIVAFEDKLEANWEGDEPDHNDIVVLLKGADHTIPEFATIAIPAVAVLGLFLFFNKRKHKKE